MRYQVVFLWVLLLVVVGIDWLFWKLWKKGRIFKDKKCGKWMVIVGFVIFPVVFLSVFFIFGLLIPHAGNHHLFNAFSYFLTAFLLVYLPKFVYLLVEGIGWISNFSLQRTSKTYTKRHYPTVSRAKFLSQIGIIMATAPFVTILFGVLKGRFAFYTRPVKLAFPNLPKAFHGLRMIQISDLHLGSFGSNQKPLQDAVDLINSQHADIVVFTGDLVNNFAGETKDWENVLGSIVAPMGKYAILGNHDYGDYSTWYSVERKEVNFKGILSAFERFGFRLLRNESVLIEKEGESIVLSGVENWGRPPFPQYGDLERTWEKAPSAPFRVLLSHDPDHWDAEVVRKKGYDLTLSGHTHGMQFGVEVGKINWSPAKYRFKRWAGLYREGKQFLYVNRGLGYLGMPARVGMPPEITVIELQRGELFAEG
ncbi:metallophosphoesterase [Thermophagus sp. OGC60D27]|uniref:metallophosphoesterase n=1 Tax=Thermophagus sp. OGC60D27 TaxID=3458415 RepID=UPI0040379591